MRPLISASVRPNVFCVVFDTARADTLEPYGAPQGSTPAVAQLARRGLAHPDVYATACWTLPSHGSMFTGLLPRAAGLGGTTASREETAEVLHSQSDRVLPEVLRRSGYATGAVSTNVWVSKWTGFDAGFERFELVDSGRQGRIHGQDVRSRVHWTREAMRARSDDGAAAAEAVLGHWIDELDAKAPFFWFVNLVECHSPYLPPRPYNRLGPLDRLRAGIEARRHLNLEAIWRASVGEFDVPDEALDRMRTLYRGAVRYMDAWLARMLERLDARGVLDETLVVVTSDHGENFGEDGLLAHCFSLDERLIHVPLVAAGPGVERFPERLLSLAELPRLTGDIAGIDRHPWHESDLPPAGVAVAQFEPPVRPDHPRAQLARERWRLDDAGFARLTSPFACATDGRFKLTRRDAVESLRDLRDDPLELEPSAGNGGAPAPESAAALAALRSALDHPAAAADFVATEAAGDQPRPVPTDEEKREIEERMRLLGYL
jgi:arylsulfatase A-like enzyme